MRSHGMSPVSPIGFVYYGSYTAKLGDISEGYHHVKLAVSLLDKVGLRDSAGEVIAYGISIRQYIEPLQATLEHHNEGYAAAMASGDIMQAAVNILIGNSIFFLAGANLQMAREKGDESFNFMYERKMLIFMVQATYYQHSMFKLIGSDEKPKDVSVEEAKIVATNNSVNVSRYYQKAYISFIFRSYDDTKENIEKYLACISKTWANLLIHHAVHAFYSGLISFWVARKSRDRQQWHERGERSKLALKKWAESSRWTFEHKWYLLEAEESYCKNDFEVAELFYEKAISSAKEHKFVHEEALACELAGYFYAELRDTDKAMEHFLRAHEKYHEWGAFGKCDCLFKFVERIFTPLSVGVGYSVKDKAVYR